MSFSLLPNDIVKYIAVIVLNDDIRAAISLMFNRRMEAIVDVLWPQVARSKLVFSPRTATISDMCHAFDPVIDARATDNSTIYSVTFSRYDDPHNYDERILYLEEYTMDSIRVISRNYLIVFIACGTRYIVSKCLHREVLSPDDVIHRLDTNDTSPTSIEQQLSIKRLMTKIIPEFIYMLDFEVQKPHA
jgi:hypothetical protein